MKLLGCAVVVVAAMRTARADDDEAKAMKALVAAQVQAINTHDAKAFAATFVDDGFVFLPAAADEGSNTAGIQTAAKSWFARLAGATVKLDQPHYGMDWFDAELVVSTGKRLRMTGVLRAVVTEPMSWKIGAAHISEPAEDKLVIAAVTTGKLPVPPKIASKIESDSPDTIATFATRIMNHAAVAVVGSAPSEHAVGPAAASKMLAGWKSLKLRTIDGATRATDPNNMLLEYSVAHVEATMQIGGKPVKLPYRVLMVTRQPQAMAAEHGAKAELSLVHFSVATY